MNTPPEHPADREQPTDRLAILDGRDALAFVVIRPAEEDPERIAVEASARGISKAVAAYALRQTADQFDRAAIAEGDTPITPEEAAAEQQQRARQAPALDRAQPPAPQLTGEQITEYAATIRAHAFESAATIAEQVAAEMREADGTWPEEWSSRDVRDAVESAAERIRAAAEQPADVVPAHVLAAFEQDATARQAHAAAVEEPVDTFADTEETPEAAARRFARRLAAVERLCAGRPGYHTITVKALLTAMSNPDEDVTLVPYRGEHGYPEGESPAEQPTAPHPLTSNERRFLTFALDRAADTMRNEDGFTDADEDALTRLRDLAEVEQEPRILTVDEDEAAYYAARAELGLHARRIGSVTLNDALTAAFAAVGILTPPPAPAADTCPAMFATRAGEWQQCTGAPDHDPADGHDNGEWAWPDGQTHATPEDDAEAQR